MTRLRWFRCRCETCTYQAMRRAAPEYQATEDKDPDPGEQG